jgi:hypothetical protein
MAGIPPSEISPTTSVLCHILQILSLRISSILPKKHTNLSKNVYNCTTRFLVLFIIQQEMIGYVRHVRV